MNHDNSPLADVPDQLPACLRCHASKVRCRRAPGQVRCRRCTRAAYSDCHPRPSRRGQHGRIGQQQQRRGLSGTSTRPAAAGNITAEPPHDLHDHALIDLRGISMTPSGGVDLADSLWTPLASDFELDSRHAGTMTLDTTLPVTPSQPSDSVSPFLSSGESPPEDSITVSSASSRSRDIHQVYDSRTGSHNDKALGWSRQELSSSRLSSISYMQALGELNLQMLSHQSPKRMLECLRQRFLTTPPPQHLPFPQFPEEGPIEAALRLGLGLRSLLRPHQTSQRDISTALFLLSTVLRLASMLYDLLAQLQNILFQLADELSNKKALLCALVFPPARLGALTLLLDDDEWRDHDQTQEVRPLQMHSMNMALSSAEALTDEVIQLTEAALSDQSGTRADDDEGDGEGEGNIIKEDELEPLQALTRALVAKQEAVVETISALRDMLCC